MPELAHLPLALVALAPFADVAAKPLDLVQEIVVVALAPVARVRGRLIVAAAEIAELVAKLRDLARQRIDRLLQLRERGVGAAALRGIARRSRIAVPARLLAGGTWGHGGVRPAARYRGGSMYSELLLDVGSRTVIPRRLDSLLLLLLGGGEDDDDDGAGGGGGGGSGAGCAPLHFGHPHGAGAQQQLDGYGGYGGNGATGGYGGYGGYGG